MAMNKLKAVYIAIYPMLATTAAGFSIYQLATNGLSIDWLGVLLTTAPMMAVIAWLMVFKSHARTSARLPLITLLGIAGLGLTMYETAITGYDNWLPLSIALAGVITFNIYNFWYSSLDRTSNSQLSVGYPLPTFEVTQSNTENISSESFKGNPTIIVFFRGNWCPLCMAQINEIAMQYRELSSLGANIKFISPQPESNTLKLAEKHGVNFEFYTDKQNSAAKTLGIEMENGLPLGMEALGYDSDTVLPTVLITDKNGMIIYSDQTNNYRIRPEPEAFLKVLKDSQALS
jgi:peroxiredoxin